MRACHCSGNNCLTHISYPALWPSPGSHWSRIIPQSRVQENRIHLTDKTAQGLQFTAEFTKWNTSPQLEDGLFTFVAPEKAEKIDILPAAAPAPPKKKQKR